MKTNDLKKGDWVMLGHGWIAQIADNAKGTARMATVHGFETEIGSIYAHDIIAKIDIVNVVTKGFGWPINWGVHHGKFAQSTNTIEHTPAQIKLKRMVDSF